MAASSASSQGFSSSSSGSGDAVGAKSYSSDPDDTCTWYGGDVCNNPRTCDDCLNVLLTRDQQCGIDSDGMCVSTSNNHVLYSSANTSYCDATDATCQTCYSDWSATQWSSTSNPSCVGADGCVCLRICETPSWSSRVLSDKGCLWAFSYSGQQGMVSTVFEFAIMALIVLGSFKLASYFVARFLSRRERIVNGTGAVIIQHGALHRLQRQRPALREPTTGPLLGLAGWRSHQEKLQVSIQTEQLQGMAPPSLPSPPTSHDESQIEHHHQHEAALTPYERMQS